MRRSTLSLLVCYLVISLVHFLYYPKWNEAGAEATISYDVSGYYMYLPAAFIYDDLREVKFLDDVIEKYRPTADPYQVFEHESGAKVMKYSVGQAVMYAPFFAIAHGWASASPAYPPDGFSFPYQFMISLGSLVVSFLGLYWLTVLLRHYFRDGIVAATVFLVALGTNYLNYSAIDGAMTHNNVFTLASLLLLSSHRFYVRAQWSTALTIGACLGLMALTRPTEITAAIIPLLWGLDLRQKNALSNRFQFFGEHWPKLLAAAAVTLSIGSLQLIYWKYVSGDWIVYSYQDQGFDWFKAHIAQGLYSYKAGWLTYTPLMIFALIGFIPLFRQKTALFPALFLHAVVFIYVAFAWSVWWYGGSLGQRTMVQEYAVLSFPFAAFLTWVFPPRAQRASTSAVTSYLLSSIFCLLIALFVYHNLWFTHQAHRGGLFKTEQMTKPYFWRTLYTFGHVPDNDLLLDPSEFYSGEPARRDTVYFNDLENLSTAACGLTPVNGRGALCLVGEEQNGPSFYVDVTSLEPGAWLRASVACKIDTPRGGRGGSAQMLLTFRRDGEEIKRNMIRMHRVLNHDWRRVVHIDGMIPAGADQAVISFWNGGRNQPGIVLDDVTVEVLR